MDESIESVDQIKDRLDREAEAIHDEDVASCRAMGAFGASVVPDDARILTHCNAGALATAGYGTALGVVRGAVEAGKRVAVFADETRPFLQGARLTAWELVRDGIETTVITDRPGIDSELTRSTAGIPAVVFSMGRVTSASTCSGARPGASVCTVTVGGTNSGSTSRRPCVAAQPPYSSNTTASAATTPR